ncbi:MAG TPA: nitric-oxide reductase large subunit, partial [Actinomycetaceae bacterium]|nr:nitric-oxide reductase large subunit [Actinomycetaceae bacterium]
MSVDSRRTAQQPSKAELAISKGWVQGVALVLVFGFLVMGILAYRTYTASMPLPQQAVSEAGEVVFTEEEVTEGQQIFLRRGLQQYGSIVGHGAYLGPDYTAEYLRLSAEHVRESLETQGVQDPQAATSQLLRTNRYDEATGDVVLTNEQIAAFEDIRSHYADFFGVDTTEHGLLPSKITDPDEIHALTAFFAWTAWAAAAERPGHTYSYTNNWPPEPRVENTPTADILVWSGISLVALLAGLGILFAIYGRWSRNIGWKGSESPSLRFLQPGAVGITKAQKATAWFFLVVS